MITLYTTGCPLCRVLESKLAQKNISYETCTDVDQMMALGITHVPVLSVDGALLQMQDAMKYIERKATEV